MEINIYTNRCLTCSDNQRIETIQFIAKKHGIKVIMRRVYVLPELRAKAVSFGTPMPFLELNGKTLDFYKVGEYMLKDEALEEFVNEAINEHTNKT